jgi:hypothetical protein
MPTLSPNLLVRTSGAIEAAEEEELPQISQSPVLQAALLGLDISLDQELDRYRHWQNNGQSFSYLNPFKSSQPLNQSINQSDSDRVNQVVAPKLPTIATQIIAPQFMVKSSGSQHPTGYPTEQQAESNSNESSAFLSALVNPGMDDTAPVNEDDLMRDMADSYGEGSASSVPETSGFNLLSPFGIASLLLLLLTSAVVGYLVVDPAGLTKLLHKQDKNAAPKTSSYLPADSSGEIDLTNSQNTVNRGESLLVDPKNLNMPFVSLPGDSSRPGQTSDRFTDVEPAIKVKKTSNVKAVKALPPRRNFDLSVPPIASSSPLREVPPPSYQSYSSPPIMQAPPQSYDPPVPRYKPNRTASRSFSSTSSTSSRYKPSRNSLQNGNIPSGLILSPSSQPSSSSTSSQTFAPPVAIAPPTSSRSVVVKVPNAPASGQSIQPISRASVPVQYGAPISAPTAPSSSTSNSGSGYRIVVPSNYLTQAQEVEKEAFIRPSDNNVQLGSFRDASTAQQRAVELRNQGIPVEVVPR